MTAISAITAQSGRRAWPHTRTALWVWVAVIGIAITLGPLVQSMRYVLLGAVTAAVVLGTSVALRVLRVPPIYYVPVQLLVLIEWATLTFFRADAWGVWCRYAGRRPPLGTPQPPPCSTPRRTPPQCRGSVTST
ncbi:MAG: hypothetical protein WKF83_08740 [Nocardioidaceae bacterium]